MTVEVLDQAVDDVLTGLPTAPTVAKDWVLSCDGPGVCVDPLEILIASSDGALGVVDRVHTNETEVVLEYWKRFVPAASRKGIPPEEEAA